MAFTRHAIGDASRDLRAAAPGAISPEDGATRGRDDLIGNPGEGARMWGLPGGRVRFTAGAQRGRWWERAGAKYGSAPRGLLARICVHVRGPAGVPPDGYLTCPMPDQAGPWTKHRSLSELSARTPQTYLAAI